MKNKDCETYPSCHPEWSEAESNPEGARHSLGVYEGIDSKNVSRPLHARFALAHGDTKKDNTKNITYMYR